MLTITDIIFSDQLMLSTKQALLELIHDKQIRSDVQVLKPTATNDDVNGSQHASNGGNDFGYEDATMDDVTDGSSLGYYEYFSESFAGQYTGHYYNGHGAHFAAVVIDPPAYAVSVNY